MRSLLTTMLLATFLLPGCASYEALHRYDAADAQMAWAQATAARVEAEMHDDAVKARQQALDSDAAYRAVADRVFAHQPALRQQARDALPPLRIVTPDPDIRRDQVLADQQADFDDIDAALLKVQLGIDDGTLGDFDDFDGDGLASDYCVHRAHCEQ